MSNEQIAKIMAGEHINYICREAGRIFPNLDKALVKHTASYLTRIELVKKAIKTMPCDAFNKAHNSQIPAKIFAAMREYQE